MAGNIFIPQQKIQGLDRITTIERAMDKNANAFAAQLILIRTRVDALEITFFGGRLSLIWTLMVSILSPKIMAAKVAATHQRIMNQFNEMQKKQTAGLIKATREEGGPVINGL